jgi:hypothetical protein
LRGETALPFATDAVADSVTIPAMLPPCVACAFSP